MITNLRMELFVALLEREEERVAEGGELFYLYFVWLRRRADRSVCSVQLAGGDYNLRRITITAIRHGGRVTTIINTHNCRGSGVRTLHTGDICVCQNCDTYFSLSGVSSPSFFRQAFYTDHGRNIGLEYQDLLNANR